MYYTMHMDIGKILYLLVQGFFLGYGPCLVTCVPILLPYTITKGHWKEGLEAALTFSLSRLAVYVVLGGLSGYIGAFLMQYYYTSMFKFYIQGALVFALILIGTLILFGKDTGLKFCRVEEGNMVILGILVGLSPCLPLLGILLEIALLSNNFLEGMIYSFSFGIGTVLSPMLIIGALAPVVGRRIDQRIKRGFVFICGLLIILMGVYIFRNLIGTLSP